MPPLPRPLLIGSEIYRSSTYGGKHPLGVPRVAPMLDLVRALGWLDAAAYVDSPRATPEQLGRFHDPDYIAAVQRAERRQRATDEERTRYNIGANGNPVFGEMFRRPATASGASILAAELLADGGIVHSPAGGTHHGRRAQAYGFCYFNDPVLGILAMLDRGLERVFYLDIDAHHGDGVQDAFADDDRVLTVSVHEHDRWPRTGPLDDRAGGMARNLPVPAGFNDSELAYVVDRAVLPLIDRFAPQAIVLQCGADALAEDPMSRLELSNNAHWRTVAAIRDQAPRLLVLGGGGYNPWATARCWTGVWATLNDIPVPRPEAALPHAAETVLRGLHWNRRPGRTPPEHWFTTLADAPRDGPVREEVRAGVAALLA